MSDPRRRTGGTPLDSRAYAAPEQTPRSGGGRQGITDPDELRLDIDLTRDELGGTVDALAQKLNVSGRVSDEFHDRTQQMRASAAHLGEHADALAGRVSERLPDSAAQRFDKAIATIKANPGPSAAAALVGLALLRKAGRRRR
ncbi:DUF3618 domain-containing protein [Actinoalloteichus hymeniacidonis]|uniref:DUF3618 family protein n=1 Tax=Actinoalloteichus hymeniacidonis TaxID=340345 RepID=A0AAC9HUP9_9PSEU|nr:DUF3618 domain-containing protein [Actinoalloteichus hymeniacidonis]AOS64865.1 putative DUF3618 family protein [Actinoalloteichus hymeniacidonis]MBB5907060.1 hypothetical protein [Actinoalloteichus hymeniacidonis]